LAVISGDVAKAAQPALSTFDIQEHGRSAFSWIAWRQFWKGTGTMLHEIATSDKRDRQELALTRLPGVAVIIPACNEEASLPRVLGDLPAVDRVIVADNGSTDATASIARRHGAQVVYEGRRGYGQACLAALAHIEREIQSGHMSAPNVVVFLDADYSDHPERMPELVEPILHDKADFVLGSRLAGRRQAGAMPPQSVWGNRLACLLMRLLWGARYTDLGPFRAIRYEALHMLRMEDRTFGWTVEMQIKALAAGLRILEVPLPYRRRIGTSKISGTLKGSLQASAKILLTIGKYGWQCRRRVLQQQRPEMR
jgi:hypothetical protein